MISSNGILKWLREELADYKSLKIENMTTSFQDGTILCALIDRYEPDLLNFEEIDSLDRHNNIDKALKILEDNLEIPHLIEGEDMVESPNAKTMSLYMSCVVEKFQTMKPKQRTSTPTSNGERELTAKDIKVISKEPDIELDSSFKKTNSPREQKKKTLKFESKVPKEDPSKEEIEYLNSTVQRKQEKIDELLERIKEMEKSRPSYNPVKSTSGEFFKSSPTFLKSPVKKVPLKSQPSNSEQAKDISSQIIMMSKLVQEGKNEIEQLKRKLKEKDDEIFKIQQQNNNNNNKPQQRVSQNNVLNNSQTINNNENERLKKLLEEKEKKIVDLQNQLNTSKDTSFNNEKRANQLSLSLENLKLDSENKKNEVFNLQNKLNDLQTNSEKEKQQLLKSNKELFNQIQKQIEISSSFDEKLQGYERRVGELGDSLEKKNREVESLQKQVQQSQKEKNNSSQLEDSLKNSEKKVSELNDTLEKKNVEIENLKKQISQKERELLSSQSNEEKLKTSERKINELNEIIEKKNNEIEIMKKRNSQNERSVSPRNLILEDKLKTSEKKVLELNETIENLKKQTPPQRERSPSFTPPLKERSPTSSPPPLKNRSQTLSTFSPALRDKMKNLIPEKSPKSDQLNLSPPRKSVKIVTAKKNENAPISPKKIQSTASIFENKVEQKQEDRLIPPSKSKFLTSPKLPNSTLLSFSPNQQENEDKNDDNEEEDEQEFSKSGTLRRKKKMGFKKRILRKKVPLKKSESTLGLNVDDVEGVVPEKIPGVIEKN